MSFAFKPGDASVRTGVRRIARSELASALAILEAGPPDPAAVHKLRRHSKKLRGLIRLIRPVFPRFAPVNRLLRDGARRIAALREAEVRLATLRSLAESLPDPALAAPALAALADEVEDQRQPARMDEAIEALHGDFAALHAQLDDWKLTAKGWAALAPGLEQTLRAARRQRKEAARAFGRGSGGTVLHEWRKSVKHHWYQARLLSPLWPEMLAPRIAAADVLGEDLGLHNDLDLLVAYLAAHEDPAVAAVAQGGALAGDARRDLAAGALARGARLFAERPRAVSHTWGIWWDEWRAGR